jgi:hypothetical protein
MARSLARFYGHFAAALGTFILLVLPVAHRLPVPGWAYLYVLPILAVGYAAFRTASMTEPTIEQLYREIHRREALAQQAARGEAAPQSGSAREPATGTAR